MKTFLPPLQKPKNVRIVRGEVSLWPPVVLGDAIYVGYPTNELVKLDRNLAPVWKIPSAGFDVSGHAADVILQKDRKQHLRAVQQSGEIAWIRDMALGTGVAPWRDRLLLVEGSKLSFLDTRTGADLEHIDFGGSISGGLLGDIFLFRTTGAEEVECAFDLVERRHMWQRNLFDAIQSRFVIWAEEHSLGRTPGSPGRFVGTYADHILGFSMEDGEPLWCVPGFVPSGGPLVQDGRVYAWTCDKSADYTGHLICIDDSSGEVIYDRSMQTYNERELSGMYMSPCVLAGQYIAFTTRFGFLALFRLSDGELVWSYKYKHELYTPVVADNRLLVTSSDGNLLVFEGQG